MRARLAISASSQQCELREVVLRDKPQALVQASPKATVPVLVLPSSQVLEQSLDIMLWALQQHDPEGWLAPEHGNLDAMLALIGECDEVFKPALDRYKYPQRFSYEHVGGSAAKPGLPKAVATLADDNNALDAAAADRAGVVAPAESIDAHRTRALAHRSAGADWLFTLDARLAGHKCLFGSRVSLADMAIAPFVRQYAHVDREWFDAQAWVHLRTWLDVWMASDLFAGVMTKYRPWAPDSDVVLFP